MGDNCIIFNIDFSRNFSFELYMEIHSKINSAKRKSYF